RDHHSAIAETAQAPAKTLTSLARRNLSEGGLILTSYFFLWSWWEANEFQTERNAQCGFQSDFCSFGVERWTLSVCLFMPGSLLHRPRTTTIKDSQVSFNCRKF